MRRVADWQRTQQDSVKKAEDGGVSTNAQPESDDGDRREARTLQQHSNGITKVVVHRCQVPGVRCQVEPISCRLSAISVQPLSKRGQHSLNFSHLKG